MTIGYEVRDRIAFLSFSRPEKHNALRDQDVLDLNQALRRLDFDDEADVGILHGQGRSFSSGADVADRLQGSVDQGSPVSRQNEVETILVRCWNWKPLIAAVHGYALGHALGTALLCDFLVAERTAKMQCTEVTIGVPVPRLWQSLALISETFANDVLMTGRFFTAEEADKTGMITRLVEVGEHLPAAEEFAKLLLANPQGAVRELVRLRRSNIAEAIQHAISVGGTYHWATDSESQDRIASKLSKS